MHYYVYVGKKLVNSLFVNKRSAYDIGTTILELNCKYGEKSIIIVSPEMLDIKQDDQN
jgi:hypothetical protein